MDDTQAKLDLIACARQVFTAIWAMPTAGSLNLPAHLIDEHLDIFLSLSDTIQQLKTFCSSMGIDLPRLESHPGTVYIRVGGSVQDAFARAASELEKGLEHIPANGCNLCPKDLLDDYRNIRAAIIKQVSNLHQLHYDLVLKTVP